MSEDEWVSGKVGLSVGGVPMEFELTVPASPVKPKRMLPIFQQMANSIVSEGVRKEQSKGRDVSCKAGCSACCRQPVPVSGPEVYHIAELVEAMPEPRRSEVKERFRAATKHLHDIEWFERFADHRLRTAEMTDGEARAEGISLVMEYFAQGVECPFLENDSCSIHPDRPIVCREYLVTSPAENCSDPQPQTIRMVDLIMKPSISMRAIGKIEDIDELEYPILAQVLEIADRVADPYTERSGPEWMRAFFAQLSGDEVKEKVQNAVT